MDKAASLVPAATLAALTIHGVAAVALGQPPK